MVSEILVYPVVFTTAKHCPQKWPKKDGVPYWRCPDPIKWFMEIAGEKRGGAVCQRHLDFYRTTEAHS